MWLAIPPRHNRCLRHTYIIIIILSNNNNCLVVVLIKLFIHGSDSYRSAQRGQHCRRAQHSMHTYCWYIILYFNTYSVKISRLVLPCMHNNINPILNLSHKLDVTIVIYNTTIMDRTVSWSLPCASAAVPTRSCTSAGSCTLAGTPSSWPRKWSGWCTWSSIWARTRWCSARAGRPARATFCLWWSASSTWRTTRISRESFSAAFCLSTTSCPRRSCSVCGSSGMSLLLSGTPVPTQWCCKLLLKAYEARRFETIIVGTTPFELHILIKPECFGRRISNVICSNGSKR